MTTATTESFELSESDFRKISKLVYEHCGINLHDGKKELVRARLAKRIRQGGFPAFSDYMRHVMQDQTGREFSILIDSLSTNFTSFFRERQHFDYLSDVFLPPLLEKKQSRRDFRLRVWSAGCSSGEEPYSLAITLLESIEAKGKWDLKILATDISTRMLKTAKEGLYPAERVAPVSKYLANKYLIKNNTQEGKLYQANDRLKNVIIFRYLNLMEPWPVQGPVDCIFCRNVMIYFDKPTQERLVNKYWEVLSPGGLLFTGHSESLTGITHKFKYVQPTIYSKP